MTKRYFLLLSRQRGSRRWGVEFGDYNHETVMTEQKDLRYGIDGQHFEYRIISSAPDQASVDAAVAAINR